MDTGGQEKFKSLNTTYYKKADCCLLVYDITNKDSFDQCKEYYNEKIKECAKKNIQVIVLGNKADLESKREVPSELGANFALENKYIFMETSCTKNENVYDAFETLIEITYREMIKNGNLKKKETITISSKKSNNKKNKCEFLTKK